MTILYSPKYDALYDAETGQWTEPECGDPTCEFCAHRPTSMPVNNINEEDTQA